MLSIGHWNYWLWLEASITISFSVSPLRHLRQKCTYVCIKGHDRNVHNSSSHHGPISGNPSILLHGNGKIKFDLSVIWCIHPPLSYRSIQIIGRELPISCTEKHWIWRAIFWFKDWHTVKRIKKQKHQTVKATGNPCKELTKEIVHYSENRIKPNLRKHLTIRNKKSVGNTLVF